MENFQNTTNEVAATQNVAPNNRTMVTVITACVITGLVVAAGTYFIVTQNNEKTSSVDITTPPPSSAPIQPPVPSVQNVAPASAPVSAPTPAPAQLPINSAQVKGINAQIKASMANMRATAELHYDMNNYSYAGVCNSDMVSDSVTTVNNISPSKLICNDGPTYWVAEGQLQGGNGYFCVDSSGYALTYTSSRGEAMVACK
jgi:hypothetical protein